MKVALPDSNAIRAGSSMNVRLALTAPPDFMPSTISCSALRFSGESSSALVPSSERIRPPAAEESSTKLQVRPSYGAPW